MARTVSDIAAVPMAGDVVEIWEGDADVPAALLRVLAVADGHVGFKEYGKGRFWTPLGAWRGRLTGAATATVVRDAACASERG